MPTASRRFVTPGFAVWRVLHRAASLVVLVLGLVHSLLTAFFYATWTADAAWFLGTGVGLVAIGALNLAHVGMHPCRQPTAPVLRWINYLFAALGLAAILAVPEVHAFLLLSGLTAQAIAGRWTLAGPAHL